MTIDTATIIIAICGTYINLKTYLQQMENILSDYFTTLRDSNDKGLGYLNKVRNEKVDKDILSIKKVIDLTPLASKGDSIVCGHLAKVYRYGKGVKRDDSMTVQYNNVAVNAGIGWVKKEMNIIIGKGNDVYYKK